MVYTTGVGVQVYINNTVVVQQNTSTSSSQTTARSGHIVIGRDYVDDTSTLPFYGKLTVDWLTIWDQPDRSFSFFYYSLFWILDSSTEHFGLFWILVFLGCDV